MSDKAAVLVWQPCWKKMQLGQSYCSMQSQWQSQLREYLPLKDRINIFVKNVSNQMAITILNLLCSQPDVLKVDLCLVKF